MVMMQVTQSTIGLVDRNLYSDENVFTVAYRKFMRDLALALTNVTSTIDDDVTAIFEFEKMLARVNLSSFIFCFISLIQYHSTRGEQMANIGNTVRTTVENLSRTINTSVSVSFVLSLFLSLSACAD